MSIVSLLWSNAWILFWQLILEAPLQMSLPPFTTTTPRSPKVDVPNTCLMVPELLTKRLLTLENMTTSDLALEGTKGGRPSYLMASALSLSKLGVSGGDWKEGGFSKVCGSSN